MGTIRGKLWAIVGGSALAFVVLLVTSAIVGRRVDTELANIEQRYLPKLELGPRLQGQFEKSSRAFQDAVAAHDPEALAATASMKKAFLDSIAEAKDAVDVAEAAELRTAIESYYDAAFDVSHRLIAAESGEGIVQRMTSMQERQAHLKELINRTAAFDRAEITQAFAAANRAQTMARRVQLGMSVSTIGLVLVLSMWLSRGAIRTLSELETGFERFGSGDLSTPIAVITHDELGTVAEQANSMAARLARLNAERDRGDWLKTGSAGLNEELRGELGPKEVAARAARFVARHLDVPCAALYVIDPARGVLAPEGVYGRSGDGTSAEIASSFRVGEGLVGQAALEEGITVVEDVPETYVRIRSGLGEAVPRTIALVPLLQNKKAIGVLELASFKPWKELDTEWVLSTRESIAIALEVARARDATRELLLRTQEQASRLRAQEEELRAANDELRNQQEELQQTNEELTDQARKLEQQRQILEEKNEELMMVRRGLEQKAQELTTVSAYKSQFLANMSHELRTPLNSMLLLSNLLAENIQGNLTPKQVEYAQTVHAAGSDLLSLINQVLDLAKVEAGKQEVNVTDVSLRTIAEHSERVFRPLAKKKNLELVIELDPALPATIPTDHQRLVQILNNLLGNAIKFTERGSVRLRIGRPTPDTQLRRSDLDLAGAVAFVVSDTGVGIAKEHQERVFAPFEQVYGASDRRFGGTGLGLAIARELGALLGGEMQLRSVLNEGSTFTLILPEAAPKAAAVPAQTGTVAPASKTNEAMRALASLPIGSDYLLVIEDDQVFADTVGGVIHDLGFSCVAVPDGVTGIRIAQERRPRGIILDVKLPDVDGWTIMDRLRNDPALAGIPVHFLSAIDDAARGLAMGAVGYSLKPTTRRGLVQVIESITAKAAPSREWRVLIVEPDDRRASSILGQLAGERLETRRVTAGRAALEALEREGFQCVVLELGLPDMSGFELVELLAARDEKRKPAIVVYTTTTLTKPDAKRLEACNAVVVLESGSSQQRLLDEIRRFVARLQDGHTAAQAITTTLPSEIRLDGRKVLLVDDDMRTVYALSAALRAKGVDVVVADTGRAALETLDSTPSIQAVLMDMMMPEMDGYEATRRLREDPRFRSLPVVALTAKAMKGDREKCIEAGATEYLCKPIDADRLLTVLHALIPEKASHAR